MEESANTNLLIHNIKVLHNSIRKSKKSLISLDANYQVLEQLGLMTKTKDHGHKLIGCYNKLFGSDLTSDLKSLSGNIDIQKRYLKPFITLGIVQGDYPFELDLSKNEIDDLVSKCPLDEADSISSDSNTSKSSSGCKNMGCLGILFAIIGAITGLVVVFSSMPNQMDLMKAMVFFILVPIGVVVGGVIGASIGVFLGGLWSSKKKGI